MNCAISGLGLTGFRGRFSEWVTLVGMALATFGIYSSPIGAQEYPTQTIKVIVPWPAGGAVDSMMRIVARRLSERLGQGVIVENRPGANGIVGTVATARSPADGYTISTTSLETLSINPSVYPKLPYDPIADFVPVMTLIKYGYAVTARAELPANSMKEAVTLVKSQPGKFTYGTWGIGSLNHLSMEMLAQTEGLKMLHVPFSGGPITTLLAGQVDLVVMPAGLAEPLRKSAKLKVLGLGMENRHSLMESVPTLKEQGYNLDITNHLGLIAPAKTPTHVIQKLYTEGSAVLRMADVQEALKAHAAVPFVLSSQEYVQYLRTETMRWKTAAEKANVRLELN